MGSSIPRKDLDEGKRTDEDFAKLLCHEYTNRKNKEYDVLNHQDKMMFRASKPKPGLFDDGITQNKLLDSFKDLRKEYDHAFQNWKRSGCHSENPPPLL